MIRAIAITMLLVGTLVSCKTPVIPDEPQPILPESFVWLAPANAPAVKAAWVVGGESQRDNYLLRVKLMRGGRIPPHTHPDTRYTTVLSGTLYVGFGRLGDDSKLVAVPAGAVYRAPGGVPHFLWARDSEVEYQESGVGPTATQLVASKNRLTTNDGRVKP